jgi:hypothetical protein
MSIRAMLIGIVGCLGTAAIATAPGGAPDFDLRALPIATGAAAAGVAAVSVASSADC